MDEIVKSNLDSLSARERAAYHLSISRKEPFLSYSLQEQLYNLYQAGKTCEEIQALNPRVTLGTIVRARVDNKWDERRDVYINALFQRARLQGQQMTMESVAFIGDLIAAFHKHDQAKLQRFVQTGDEEEMKNLLVLGQGLKAYKDVLGLLMLLTGQVKPAPSSGPSSARDVTPPSSPKPLSPEEAALVLAQSVGKGDDGS